MEQQELSVIVSGNSKCTVTFGDSLAVYHKTKHTLTIRFTNHVSLVFMQMIWKLMFVQKLEHVFDNKKLLSALSTIKKKKRNQNDFQYVNK